MALPLLDFAKIGSGNKDLGLTPGALERSSTMKGVAERALKLPGNATPESVQSAARSAAELKAQAVLIRKESKYRLSAARSAASIHGTRTAHAAQARAIDEQFQSQDLQHQQGVLAHAQTSGENRSALSGYQAVYQANAFSLN